MDELHRIATTPVKRRSPWMMVGVVIASIVALYLVMVVISGIGWDGY
jgi:hypothetical protein